MRLMSCWIRQRTPDGFSPDIRSYRTDHDPNPDSRDKLNRIDRSLDNLRRSRACFPKQDTICPYRDDGERTNRKKSRSKRRREPLSIVFSKRPGPENGQNLSIRHRWRIQISRSNPERNTLTQSAVFPAMASSLQAGTIRPVSTLYTRQGLWSEVSAVRMQKGWQLSGKRCPASPDIRFSSARVRLSPVETRALLSRARQLSARSSEVWRARRSIMFAWGVSRLWTKRTTIQRGVHQEIKWLSESKVSQGG